MYNFRCRTRIAGGFMIRDYVANQSKDNNNKKETPEGVSFICVTIKLEFVVKVCTVEVVFISTVLRFPVETVVSS